MLQVLNIILFPVSVAASFVTLSWNTSQSLARDYILQVSPVQIFLMFLEMFFYNAVLARCVRQLTSGVTIVCYLQLWCKLGDHFTLANIRQESVTTSRTFITIASFITSEFRR